MRGTKRLHFDIGGNFVVGAYIMPGKEDVHMQATDPGAVQRHLPETINYIPLHCVHIICTNIGRRLIYSLRPLYMYIQAFT